MIQKCIQRIIKFLIAERFIRTLKNKIYKHMTSVSKNVDIDKLDDTVNEYNNTYYSTIKMKPADVKPNIFINSDKEINNKNPKSKVCDIVRISKYKNILQKVILQIDLNRFLWFKKLKTLCRGDILLVIVMENKLLDFFMKKLLEKK